METLTCHYGLIEPPNVPNGSDERERDAKMQWDVQALLASRT